MANTDRTPGERPLSVWQRFLEGKTAFQRLVIALGALAAAVLAIAGVVVGAAKILDERVSVGPADGEVQQIQNQQKTADAFVMFLLEAAKDRSPVPLDQQVVAPRGPGGEFRLEYNCDDAGLCNFVRLETPNDIPDTLRDGVWYRGCLVGHPRRRGYAADHLDLELRKQGTTCPCPDDCGGVCGCRSAPGQSPTREPAQPAAMPLAAVEDQSMSGAVDGITPGQSRVSLPLGSRASLQDLIRRMLGIDRRLPTGRHR